MLLSLLIDLFYTLFFPYMINKDLGHFTSTPTPSLYIITKLLSFSIGYLCCADTPLFLVPSAKGSISLFLFNFYWNIVDLQCRVRFRCTTK